MTFDLTPELTAAQARAREAATSLRSAATAIDATGVVPPDVLAALEPLALDSAPLPSAVLMVEELAAASAAGAARSALHGHAPSPTLAGLRGAPLLTPPDDRQRLILAAVCLGIGRAALDEAIRVARARGDRPAGDPAAPPHWALADAATETDAARLLVYAAAAGEGLPAAAVLVFAAGAATRTVEAALRIVGPEGYVPGSLLERCARDARAAALILGTEDDARLAAARAMLEGA